MQADDFINGADLPDLPQQEPDDDEPDISRDAAEEILNTLYARLDDAQKQTTQDDDFHAIQALNGLEQKLGSVESEAARQSNDTESREYLAMKMGRLIEAIRQGAAGELSENGLCNEEIGKWVLDFLKRNAKKFGFFSSAGS